jgi:ABC-type glycerol-3-phosphate transport system substrate-binding protein
VDWFIGSLTTTGYAEYWKFFEKDFEKKNPDIDLYMYGGSWQMYWSKIFRDLMAGIHPDIAGAQMGKLHQWTRMGFVEPLDRYIEGTEIEDFPSMPLLRIEDSYRGVPGRKRAICLIYRESWLEEAGLEPPKNHEDVYVAAKKLTVPEKTQYGFGLVTKGHRAMYERFFEILWGMTQKHFSTEEGVPLLTSPHVIEALTYAKRLIDEQLTPIGVDYRHIQEWLREGKIAMHPGHPSVFAAIEKKKPDVFEDFWIVPGTFGNGYARGAVSMVYFIPTKAKHKEAAWKVLEHWCSLEMQRKFLEYTLTEPDHPEAITEEFLAKYPYFRIYMKAMSPEYSADEAPPGLEIYTVALQDIFAQHLEEVYYGGVAPEKAMVAAQQAWLDYIEEAKKAEAGS